MTVNGKTIVVTGVSAGIGAETAKLLKARGARVFGISRSEPELDLDGFIRTDLSEPLLIDAAIAELPDQIDGLCNIAGIPGTLPSDLVGRVNYLGVRHLCERLIDRIPAGGAIINTASILGRDWHERLSLHKELGAASSFDSGLRFLEKHPVPQEFCYQYFKEALIVWSTMRSQAWYLERGVRMNCVSPGPVQTKILGDFVRMLGEERIRKDAQRIKRPGMSAEIAPAYAFLCSGDSSWISGANLPIDGGLASTYV